jgi:hypothetical protein
MCLQGYGILALADVAYKWLEVSCGGRMVLRDM